METNIFKLLVDFWQSKNIWLLILKVVISICFLSLTFATYGITLLQLVSGMQAFQDISNSNTEVNIDMPWLISNSQSALGLFVLFLAAFMTLTIFAVIWVVLDHLFGEHSSSARNDQIQAMKNLEEFRKAIESQRVIGKDKSDEL